MTAPAAAPAAALTVRDRTPQVGDVLSRPHPFDRSGEKFQSGRYRVSEIDGSTYVLLYHSKTARTPWCYTLRELSNWCYRERSDNGPLTTPAEEAR